MKKVTAAVFALAFILTGCSSGTGSPFMPVSPTQQVSISVTNYLSFASENEYSYYYDRNAKDTWIDYMSLHNYTDFTIYNEQFTDSVTLVESDEREGLVLCNSPLEIKRLANQGKILPLDKYLADNPAWMALPEAFRNTFEIDGKIYAIPYSTGSVVESGLTLNGELAINTKWLEQLGLSMPKTLEEFENVGKQFAQNDMSGDGIVGNDYLLCFFNPLFNFHIFQAYGLYCGLPTSTTFGYDPELGCIADALFKDNAEPALAYMMRLYTEGVIDPASAAYYNFDSISKDAMAGKYGTIFMTNAAALLEAGMTYAAANYERITGKTYDPTDIEVLQWAADVFEPIPPLSTQYPLTYSDSPYGYVMTTQTAMPKEVINRFVDLCYGFNGTTYLECNFGTESAYTLKSDGTCIVPGYQPLHGIALGNTELSACPNLGGYYQNSLGENFIVTSGQGSGANYAEVLAGLENKITGYIGKYEAANLMVKVPAYYAPCGATYRESAKLFRRNVYGDLFRALLIESNSVGDALKTYREDAIFFGIADILKESNGMLGLPNKQKVK